MDTQLNSMHVAAQEHHRHLQARAETVRSCSRRDAPGGLSCLSEREWDVLALVAARYTDREIADQLFISYRTVTTHVGSILSKLNVGSRRDAAAIAIGPST
ncbi:MAG TPA: helix-turn-helix transcriptional regulator [Thermomicrobiales bacterium]|nr:helix-turn-helix transcriptional regulator [Thermomicrobiales bacterium]